MDEIKNTVLLVEDDDDVRDMTEMILKDMNFKVHSVNGSLKAKEWMESNTPALIMLDIMMPDGNGLDLCRFIRSQERFQNLPILIASALEDDETAQDAMEMGTTDFIRKPFSMEALQEKIKRICSRGHSL
ncbi:MAG: response regulator [bacterium]